MNPPAASEGPAKQPPPRQRIALVSLLADEDPAVFRMVRSKVLSFGPAAIEWLRPFALSGEPLLRRRVREILGHFGRQDADNRFLSFCMSQGEDFNLEQGVWMLTRTQYPEINVAGYQALLDNYAGELRESIDFSAEPRDILRALNRYLFEHLRFQGDEENYYDAENSYPNRVMDRRTGNPISLCLIYLCLCRRLHLPVTGIGLPGHFICRYQSSRFETYIDVFNKGKFLSKADCIQYLVQTNHGLGDGYLAPASPRRTLMRICANLHQIYLHREQSEEVGRFQRYLVILAK
jgi:regulator of sirC expression with transglutaminase-like and TPR domain